MNFTKPFGSDWDDRSKAVSHYQRILRTSWILMVVFLLIGCASVMPASNPVYPTLGEGESKSTLVLVNNAHSEIYQEALEVTIDGFSPTKKEFLPKGKTEVPLQPGNHEISHYLKTANYKEYSPVTIRFNAEAGKIYVITFETFMERRQKGLFGNKRGYRIRYSGWSDEEISKWPIENMSRKSFP